MTQLHSRAFSCRHCQHYKPHGRRGGECQQLNVPVQGSWKACAMASLAFAPTWDNIKELVKWQQEARILEEVNSASTSNCMAAEEVQV